MKDLWSNLASDLQDTQFQLLYCFIFASTAILIWVLGLTTSHDLFKAYEGGSNTRLEKTA